MTLGEATGLFGLIRALLLDRPSVKIMLRAVDHGPPERGIVVHYTGAWIHVDVHATGRIPVRVKRVGIELDDGQVVALTSGDLLEATITRPESVHRTIELPALRAAVRAAGAGRRARRIRVEASLNHVFRSKLPKGWGSFPETDPPLAAGDAEGFIAAFL
jgi:hypothetical protein